MAFPKIGLVGPEQQGKTDLVEAVDKAFPGVIAVEQAEFAWLNDNPDVKDAGSFAATAAIQQRALEHESQANWRAAGISHRSPVIVSDGTALDSAALWLARGNEGAASRLTNRLPAGYPGFFSGVFIVDFDSSCADNDQSMSMPDRKNQLEAYQELLTMQGIGFEALTGCFDANFERLSRAIAGLQ